MPLIGRIASAAARGYGLFANVIQAVDPFFNYVVALLHGDGTNGGQNNTFLDSSTNNFTITRNGNTTQGSFSPFSQTGWSNYFDGTGDYLSATSNAAFGMGSGDYTIECWLYLTGTPTYHGIYSTTGTTSSDIQIQLQNRLLRLSSYTAQIAIANAGTEVPLNQWTHVAFCRSGSTVRLFNNGIQVGSATDSTTWATGAIQIGQVFGLYPLNGYMSNLRVVKGTAVYTSNFTVPTTPLTAITNTSLLTCQSNRFLDASTNNFTITRNGDVSVQPFSPFNPTTAYSTSSIGGSGYFDGSGDYLTVPHNAAFDFGSGDFTMEAWVYPTTASLTSELFDKRASAGNYSQMPQIQITANQPIALASATGSSWAVTINGSSNVKPYSWNHVALTRSGSTWTLWLNGTSIGTATASITVYASTSNVVIGAADTTGTNPMNGYIADSRIVKGTAIYTAAFTPPTAPLTAIANTSFLLNFTNGAIFDNAAVADYETVGNAQISTSVKKYGTGSLAFDGTGDWLVAPASTSWDFGSGDFTVELWVNPSATTIVEALVSKGNASSTGNEVWTLQWYGTNQLAFFSGGGLGTPVVTTGSVFATGNWYHVAVCRTAGVTKIFVNGTEQGTSTTSYTITAGGALYVGAGWYAPASRDISGYIDDLRITKGVARYPYSFTPPTAAFPDIGGTVTLTADPYYEYTTLLLPGNGTNGAQNNTFLDSSTNAFTITRNGNTTQGTFSPFSQTGWGNYFDGTNDFIYVADSSAFTLGSGDFTVEAWVWTGVTSTQKVISGQIDSLGNVTSLSYQLDISSSDFPRVIVASGSTTYIATSSITLPKNQWVHVAGVRDGSTLRIYVNGTQFGTQSVTGVTVNDSSANVSVGRHGQYAGLDWNGYISNFRLVKGTCVYPSGTTFTPPTTPLTAISGTSLLTCQSNRFVDNSANAFAITANGDVSVQAFSPFNPTASWSAATYGGSGYFDGSGDYLTTSPNAAFRPSGNFTIEAWVYLSTVSGIQNFFTTQDGSGFYQFSLGTNGTNARFTMGPYSGAYAVAINGGTLTTGAWFHIAVARSGTGSNNIRMWVNGSSVAQATSNATPGTETSVEIGREAFGGSNPFTGYMGGLRIVTGSAVYDPTQSTITVPTSPLTAVTNTSLLLNYTNAGIYDATSKNDLETVGNAQISTTQSKFGGSSMYFDGTGDYLINYSSVSQNAMTFGTGDFTIEGWVNFSSTSGQQGIIDAAGSVSTGTSGQWNVNYNSNNLNFGNHGVGNILAVSFTPATGTWYHIAFTRYGSTVRGFINGVLGGTATSSVSFSAGGVQVGIGASFAAFNGYINDLRVTKGIARYTSNFTPPTTAFLTL